MSGAFGVGLQAAGRHGMLQGFLDAKVDGSGAEQSPLNAHGFGERLARLFGGGGHDSQQGVPIDQAAARKMRRITVPQSNLIRTDQNKTGFVDPAPARTPEHLQDFVWP